MKKQGILFQGLRIRHTAEVSFLGEDTIYKTSLQILEDCRAEYVDITYFLLYAMSKNPVCRSRISDMKMQWKNYLLRQAKKSPYQGQYFWVCLEDEEALCAGCILGLLEDIRNSQDDRAEKAWVSFWYLVRCGFREEYNLFRSKEKISFQEICRIAGKWETIQFMGISSICMSFLLAEDTDVRIQEDGKYPLLYACIAECRRLWESKIAEI